MIAGRRWSGTGPLKSPGSDVSAKTASRLNPVKYGPLRWNRLDIQGIADRLK
jgi:hypothetical protein